VGPSRELLNALQYILVPDDTINDSDMPDQRGNVSAQSKRTSGDRRDGFKRIRRNWSHKGALLTRDLPTLSEPVLHSTTLEKLAEWFPSGSLRLPRATALTIYLA